MSETDQPRCALCGERCWAHNSDPAKQPCWGMVLADQEPGEHPTHYCEGHGYLYEVRPYRLKLGGVSSD